MEPVGQDEEKEGRTGVRARKRNKGRAKVKMPRMRGREKKVRKEAYLNTKQKN